MKKLLIATAITATLALNACSTAPAKGSTAAIAAEAAATHAATKKQDGNVWKQKKMKKAYVDHYLAKSAAAAKKGDEAAAKKYAQLALKTANAEKTQSAKLATNKPAWLK